MKSMLPHNPWSGQTDEGEFGFTYKEADEILYGLFDEKLSETELVKRGIKLETIQKVKEWVRRVEYKHDLPKLDPEPLRACFESFYYYVILRLYAAEGSSRSVVTITLR